MAWARMVGATMPSPMPKMVWDWVAYPAAISRYARSYAAGSARPPYSSGPVIQPKPASYSVAFHVFAARISSASCSGLFSSRIPTRSEPLPHSNFSSTRGSACESRNAFASARNSASEITVWSSCGHRPADGSARRVGAFPASALRRVGRGVPHRLKDVVEGPQRFTGGAQPPDPASDLEPVTHRGLLSVERPPLQAAGGLSVGHQNQVRSRRRPAVHPSSGRRERHVIHDLIVTTLH